MELAGGKARRNPPIAIFGRQPARNYNGTLAAIIEVIIVIT